MKIGPKHITFCLILFAHVVNAQLFQEKAKESGINHEAFDSNWMGVGVAVIDFNNDGFDDIYLVGGSNDDKLYENNGNGTFQDVTEKMGVLAAMEFVKTMGVVVGDVDNDGFSDLLITTAEDHHCYLLKNEEGKLFNDVSTTVGIIDEAWSTTATMGDYDLDGDLDIYIGNYVAFSDVPFDKYITNPEADFFYQNDGTGNFTKIGNPLAVTQEGCTLVASFSDIDQDGDQDLFVLNDFGGFYPGNKLLLNNYPEESFEEKAESSGTNAEINSMGIAHGDYDEDGDLDYYVTSIGQNYLFEKQEGLSFDNTSVSNNINDGTGFSWGAVFTDVNNDSYLDLFVSKGSIQRTFDPQPNKLFIFDSENETFTDGSKDAGIEDTNRARGVAYADFNNDGKVDLVVANVKILRADKGNTLLYINSSETDNNWIKVILEGVSVNRSGYGSRITALSGDRAWVRELSGGSSYLSSHSNVVHFGLADEQAIDELTVSWPGAKEETFQELPANKTYKIIQGKGIYLYTSRHIEICKDEDVLLQGKNRQEAGVYIDTLRENGLMQEIVVTKLSLKDPNISDCHTVTAIAGQHGPDGFSVYPNPFNSGLNIELPNTTAGKCDLSIIDLSGRVVFSTKKETRPKEKIYFNKPLNPGIYTLNLKIDNKVFHERIVRGAY